MSSRSLNKVLLIGNLTRDPDLRYTPQGAAVCTLGLATNRFWTTESGEKREDAEFHRIVAWNKLAELCSQLLFKGRKIYVEGRLQTRSWTGQDGSQRQVTEVIIEEMIILDSRQAVGETVAEVAPVPKEQTSPPEVDVDFPEEEKTAEKSVKKAKEKPAEEPKAEETAAVDSGDIPF